MLVTPCDTSKILDQLEKLQQYVGTIKSEMSPRERLILYALTLCLNPSRFLEIGSFEGGSALIVCSALDTLDNAPGKIFMIDPEFQVSEATWDRIRHRSTRIAGESPAALAEAHRLAGGSFDLVLVDGAHDVAAAVSDLVEVYKYVLPGGFVLVHDHSNLEVRDAVDYVLRQGLYADVGIICDEVFYDGEFHDKGRYQGKKSFWCGTYLLRRPAESSASTGLGSLLPLLVPPLLMPIVRRLMILLRSLVSPSGKV